jgi:uncharacterized protein with PIN domain
MKQIQPAPIRFILDDAMGNLLKWLRMLGFDAIGRREYKKHLNEKMSKHEIYLTQSLPNANKATGKTIHLDQGPVSVQLRDIMTTCGMGIENLKPFSRCTLCNHVTQKIDKLNIRGKVPDYVWETHEIFRECPACHRIYWRGTHADRIEKTLQEIFNGHEGKTLYHERTKTGKK